MPTSSQSLASLVLMRVFNVSPASLFSSPPFLSSALVLCLCRPLPPFPAVPDRFLFAGLASARARRPLPLFATPSSSFSFRREWGESRERRQGGRTSPRERDKNPKALFKENQLPALSRWSSVFSHSSSLRSSLYNFAPELRIDRSPLSSHRGLFSAGRRLGGRGDFTCACVLVYWSVVCAHPRAYTDMRRSCSRL